MENIKLYKRIKFENTPIYIYSDKPDWFVPTKKADFVLQKIQKENSISQIVYKYCKKFKISETESLLDIEDVLKRIETKENSLYKGRSSYRKLNKLKEIWFHITYKCNMKCSHCMFYTDSNSKLELNRKSLLETINKAYELGCRIFYFTGGEPFLYPNFTDICDKILKYANTHVVILTNGKIIEKYDKWISKINTKRIHFQLSIDGIKKTHNKIRGKNEYKVLLTKLKYLYSKNCAVTLAMSVSKYNYEQMLDIVDIAIKYNISNIHYIWLFKKGHADKSNFVKPEILFKNLILSYEKAKKYNIDIDNIEILKSQVFSIPGTKFDLNNSCWESLAIDTNGNIFPSPALIGENKLIAGNIKDGIEVIWKNSKLLNKIRNSSIINNKKISSDLLKFISGGGDIDHSYIYGNKFIGKDPYMKLYNLIILYLIKENSSYYKDNGTCGILSKMGEKISECNEESTFVGFTHSNCVLSIPGENGYSSVKGFYSQAADNVQKKIINPVNLNKNETDHIPEESKVKNYGCGSPVIDANIQKNEVIVDLGSGSGVECFVAANKTGKNGKVIGIDMLDNMIEISKRSLEKVSKKLGYNNVEFYKAYLEKLPIEDNSVNVVISNCVINLSIDKRRTFKEIFRILKPGGRIFISDIVAEKDIPIDIKYNERLRGECLGGAMKEELLFSMLKDLSFKSSYIIKRYLYKKIKDNDFYSITYSAYKPLNKKSYNLIYRGPFKGIISEDGTIIYKGKVNKVKLDENININEDFLELDNKGNVINIKQDITCSCFIDPNDNQKELIKNEMHTINCMVCKSEIIYLDNSKEKKCYYCSKKIPTNTICEKGHFVCDSCHSKNGKEIIKQICLNTKEKDMIKLFKSIRKHPSIPIHGPEHHILVPAVILTAYKNNGGNITENDIEMGIFRGSTVAGGSCSFIGACGAATGVGIAFSVILKANPYNAEKRQIIQQITIEVMNEISSYKAGRCCQRDSFLALKKVSELSKKYLEFELTSSQKIICDQFSENKECIGNKCPLWK